MSDGKPDLMELGRITITYGLDPIHDEPMINVEREGEAENYLPALGLLSAAIDSVNNPPEEDEADE